MGIYVGLRGISEGLIEMNKDCDLLQRLDTMGLVMIERMEYEYHKSSNCWFIYDSHCFCWC